MVETGTHAEELARHFIGALVNGLSDRLVAVVLFRSRTLRRVRPSPGRSNPLWPARIRGVAAWRAAARNSEHIYAPG
jgi:hypothetical protein